MKVKRRIEKLNSKYFLWILLIIFIGIKNPLIAQGKKQQSNILTYKNLKEYLAKKKPLILTMESANRQYCYIDSIIKEQNKYYLFVDYIKFLWGDQAVKAAKKNGDAQMDINNGDTTYYVYDDYYIVNNNNKLRTFQLSNSATISLVVFNPNTGLKSGYSIKDIMNKEYGYDTTPFFIDVKNGIVNQITEQYTP